MHLCIDVSERSVLYNVRKKSKIDCFPLPAKDLCLLNNVLAGTFTIETLYDGAEQWIFQISGLTQFSF